MTKCIKEVNLGQLAGGCPRSCLLLLPSNHVVALGKLLEGSTQSKDSPRLFCRIPLYFPSALHSSWPLTLLKTDVTFHRTKFISLSAQQKLSLEQNPAETQQCTALESHGDDEGRFTRICHLPTAVCQPKPFLETGHSRCWQKWMKHLRADWALRAWQGVWLVQRKSPLSGGSATFRASPACRHQEAAPLGSSTSLEAFLQQLPKCRGIQTLLFLQLLPLL